MPFLQASHIGVIAMQQMRWAAAPDARSATMPTRCTPPRMITGAARSCRVRARDSGWRGGRGMKGTESFAETALHLFDRVATLRG